MRFLKLIAVRPDFAVVAVLVAAIAVMVIPLPTELVDLFLALNLSASVLFVMVAFYLRSSAQFTTLPALILLATVVRLALSIAVTRLILTKAYAGAIIQSFGHFVVQGNVLVGLVIFLIITIVQFIVVAKGSERVAEVAARFMLDALPGKQLAIDADLRNGQVDQDQARARRQELERESHLYGAMDGAMKFVKGDAIAGLVIIVINLLGGLGIGMLQRGLTFSDAARTYSILTVGDGLVAQIPALLVAITAGTVVTRIAGTESDNLGAEIVTQIVRDNRAIMVGGVVACGLGLVPGFPIIVFFAIGLGMIAAARGRMLRQRRAITETEQIGAPADQSMVAPSRLRLSLGESLNTEIGGETFPQILSKSVAAVGARLGITLPTPDILVDPTLHNYEFRLDLDGIPLGFGTMPERRLLLTDDRDHAILAGITVEPLDPIAPHPGRGWVAVDARDALLRFGIGFVELSRALLLTINVILAEQAENFVGIQEARAILAQHEANLPELVREATRVLNLQRLADLFRRLLADGLSLQHMRTILEAVIEEGEPGSAPGAYAEQVRSALRRSICHGHADQLRVITGFIVSPAAEIILRAALHETRGGDKQLNLPGGTIAALIERIKSEQANARDSSPVLVTSVDLRRHLRSVLRVNGLSIPVLAFSDVLPSFTLQPLGKIDLPAGSPNARWRTQANPLVETVAAE